MKLLALSLLLCFKFIAAQNISCVYENSSPAYSCFLLINNPDGFNSFTEINGTHLLGANDLNVTYIRTDIGISNNFPKIICEKFLNIVIIRIDGIGVESLDETSFVGCIYLHSINFVNNKISSINVDTFKMNPLIDTIALSNNKLRDGDFTVLHNTTQITLLYLDNNPIEDLPMDIFKPMTNLRTLHLHNTNITKLRPEWFKTLSNLVTLQLHNNSINDLPDGVFKNLYSMQILRLDLNQLKILPSLAFPCDLNNLQIINVQSNFIEAVDPIFFNKSQNLANVDFTNNQCISKSFTNFNLNRDLYLSEFSDCHEEFERILREKNACRFFIHPDFGYTCEFNNENYIEGDFDIYRVHINCLTDAEVTGVIFKSSKLTKIPQEVFTTFPNLKFLQASDVKLENVPKAECGENLKFIDFSHNSIIILDSDAFSGCSNVQEIILDDNCVAKVQPCEETFVENLTTLKSLSMVGCTCVDEKFNLETTKIEEIELKMRKCFKMWFLL